LACADADVFSGPGLRARVVTTCFLGSSLLCLRMAVRIQRGAAKDAATALTDASVSTMFGRRPNRMPARSLGSLRRGVGGVADAGRRGGTRGVRQRRRVRVDGAARHARISTSRMNLLGPTTDLAVYLGAECIDLTESRSRLLVPAIAHAFYDRSDVVRLAA
jgi:hypothetical protein